jgi:DNA processing protein
MNACDDCLRRSALLGILRHYIAFGLDQHRRLPQLLALGDDELVRALCGDDQADVRAALDSWSAEEARERAAGAGLAAGCRHDDAFPSSFADAPDAPAMLYAAGNVELLERLRDDPAVAIVGSRKASTYGLEVARRLGRELAACGVVVVSGMAFGIDSAAHEGALAGGSTIAVLGGGADYPYPRSKVDLYERIVGSGVVVSEMPPGTAPLRWCFPARNRIMAALSVMTVVVEGADNSGSLITARFAADLGREIGAVPGQVTSHVAKGPNALIADGACMVRNAQDVLDALYGPGARAASKRQRAEDGLDGRLRKLLDAVARGFGTADTIASEPGDVPSVLAGLTELELLGLVRRDATGGYIRAA